MSGGLLGSSWSGGLLQVRDGAPALIPAAQNEDEQHEQEGAVGSSHGLQSESDSASALAVRQARPHFLRTALSLAYLQTTHRSKQVGLAPCLQTSS